LRLTILPTTSNRIRFDVVVATLFDIKSMLPSFALRIHVSGAEMSVCIETGSGLGQLAVLPFVAANVDPETSGKEENWPNAYNVFPKTELTVMTMNANDI
jgi:hypothetical protein